MFRFEFRVYQRPFLQPLQTHHGVWKVREGIIIRLEDGAIGWGEIAPLDWFCSETLEQALLFCQQLGNRITEEMIFSIPDELPACQFAFESALENLKLGEYREENNLKYSYLLPTGEAGLKALPEILENQPIDTFKWKIGVTSIETELNLIEKLIPQLPKGSKLRLDANGGLSFAEAQIWLRVADKLGIIEFIEQPLPPSQFLGMLTLSESFRTPIALDESVATLKQVKNCYRQGWRGIFVVKPAIFGSIRSLRQLFEAYPLDGVFSSVFETDIGRRSSLRLAVELSRFDHEVARCDHKVARCDRALGFGVRQWFKDNETPWLETLWKTF